jgi:hypothetical protein
MSFAVIQVHTGAYVTVPVAAPRWTSLPVQAKRHLVWNRCEWIKIQITFAVRANDTRYSGQDTTTVKVPLNGAPTAATVIDVPTSISVGVSN